MAGPGCRDVGERAHRIGAVAFFFLAERGLRATGVTVLPPPLVGMFLLFTALALLERAEPRAAATLFAALEPGYRFLVKWSAVFFMPALVKMPLVEDRFSASVLLRFAIMTFLGFYIQVVFTAAVASRFPIEQDSAETLGSMEKGVAQAPVREPYPRPGRPFKRRWLPAYALVVLASPVAARLGWAPGTWEVAYMVGLTLLVLVAANNLDARVRKVAHPIVLTLLGSWAGAAVWAAMAGPEETFHDVLVHYATGAGNILAALLGPLVISLALLLFERRALLLSDAAAILTTTAAASVSGLFGTALLGRLLGLPHALTVAAVPRFVTAPLALVIAATLGASPMFAVAQSVLGGLIGATVGLPLLQTLRLPSARARGLATGASSTVLGAVSLATADPKAFPYGAVCFVLVGAMSVVLVSIPPVRALLLAIIG